MPISERILEKIKNNDATLIDLNITGNPIGDEGAQILAKAIETNTILQSIELGNSNIGEEGAIALAEALTKTNSIKTLYLRGNKLGDKGAIALAEALKMNDCLENLYLGGNQIRFAGAIALADSLVKNSTLKTIYLRNNQIGDEGVRILCEALIKNCGIETINFANTGITESVSKDLIQLLETNTLIQSLIFEHNLIQLAETINSLEEKLKYNSSLLVVTSNIIAKKILQHCEEYLKLENQPNEGQENLLLLEKKFALSRSEQYHYSGNNLQGNAILCTSFLSRMLFGKYSNKSEIENLIAISNKFYSKLFLRAKEDLGNPMVTKSNLNIAQSAAIIL